MALNLFYQSLPNKLDSLEKFKLDIMEAKLRLTLTCQILTCHLAINQRTHKYT